MCWKTAAFALTLSLLKPIPASAQLKADEAIWLRGLTSIRIVVEDVDADVSACNVRTSDLEMAAARPLVDAGIKVQPSSEKTLRAYVHITPAVILTRSGLCIASYQVSAYSVAEGAVLAHQVTPSSVYAELWTDGGVISGPPDSFGTRLSDTVRRLVDQFATKVKLANAK